MPRLTAEFIRQSLSFINPLKSRELELRNAKIPQIENLGATEDQFDIIDLSDNEIGRLENLPVLSNLKILFLSNNRINRIAPNLGTNVPNLNMIVLLNNRFTELSELAPLQEFQSLESVALLGNPVTEKPHYRAYLIHRLPNLRNLDFQKVKKHERAAANELFGSANGVALAETIEKKTNTFEPGKDESAATSNGSGASKLTPEEKAKIKAAIVAAKSEEELSRLEKALQTGVLPKELK